jgi:hypothetical protein
MALCLATALMGLAPTIAGAATHTFINFQGYGPANQTSGPANTYPGTIAVSGLAGTVTKVSVTTLDLAASDQLDMALVGPNGQAVMLLSDACSSSGSNDSFFTFEDAAPIFAPSGCSPGAPARFDPRARLMPTNIGDPALDVFSGGGPAGPFNNKLAALAGGSPNGNWNLFLIDDTPDGFGFEMGGWALHLDVNPPPPPAPPPPPPPPPPTVITVTVPPTGKRAAALSKCKNKKTKAKKQACRAKANQLPI